MKFAYADPVYYGCGKLYSHPQAHEWDDWKRHEQLICDLRDEYPEGWALSLSEPSLTDYLHALWNNRVEDFRICSWVKPFASFKPNVTVAHTWEPVILVGGRKRTREQPTIRDHLSESITLKKGLTGAKPLRFNQWILGLLNWQIGDDLTDMFPGTGGMAEAIALGVHDIGGPRSKVTQPPQAA